MAEGGDACMTVGWHSSLRQLAVVNKLSMNYFLGIIMERCAGMVPSLVFRPRQTP